MPAATFDFTNLIIDLPAPTGGLLSMDVQTDIYADWKVALKTVNGIAPPAFDVTAGDPLVPGQVLTGTYFLRNDLGWRIRPFDADQEVTFVGNLYPRDASITKYIKRAGRTVSYEFLLTANPRQLNANFSTAQQLQLAEVHGGVVREVWLDTTLVSNGNGYQQSPYNNLTDAIDFAEANGITSLVVLDDVTLDRNLKNFNVRGVGVPTIDVAGYDLKGCRFHQVKLQGNYTSEIIAQECVLLTNARLNGHFEKCALAGDIYCVSGATIFLTGCGSAVAGLGRPTITMSNGGARVLLSVRDNNGGMTIKGATHINDEVTVEVNRGSLTFDASNTNGSMVARTSGKFVDLATAAGATVTHEDYVYESWQMDRLDPDNPRETDEDGTIRVGGKTIASSTVGTTPNRTTTQTRS